MKLKPHAVRYYMPNGRMISFTPGTICGEWIDLVEGDHNEFRAGGKVEKPAEAVRGWDAVEMFYFRKRAHETACLQNG